MSLNIAVVTTVINFELYNKSSKLFPENIPHYVIDGRNGMHGLNGIYFMFKKLKNKQIDWLVMADEDVFFQDASLIYNIIDIMKRNDYCVSGVRDGGVISHRIYNPLMINTFFAILNFKKINELYNWKEIKKNQFIEENEFKHDFKQLPFQFDVNSTYEPYYCFFLWLLRKKEKFYYLDSKMPFADDKYTNSIYLDNNQLMAYHTWHARSFGKNELHTKRISRVFNLVKNDINFERYGVKPIIFKDKTFYLREVFRKFVKRVYLKIKKFKGYLVKN